MRLNTKVFWSLLSTALLLIAVTVPDCEAVSASSDPAEIREYVQSINKLTAPTPEQLFSQANAFWWLNDYKGASTAASKAIALKPDVAMYYAFRGLMYKQQQLFKIALEDMNKAESLGYKKPRFYGDRGLVRLALSDFIGAGSDADKCLLIDPENSIALYVKGSAECRLGHLQEGINYLSKSIAQNPRDALAVRRRGLAYQELGRSKEAEADFKTAKALGDSDGGVK